MTFAFIFPGQGSQRLGMLKEHAELYPQIQHTFAEASKVLGKDLWAMTLNGPEASLNRTENTQPILLAASVALWRVWLSIKSTKPQFLAGHSLGEYSALVCAQAMAFEDAVKLVHMRGQFMQAAVPEGVGSMAAVLGLDNEILKTICNEAAQNEVVAPVNYNAIGQTVIAGHKGAVERASALAKEKGAKRVLPLPVSVPSHCALMTEAAALLEKELNQINIVKPLMSVIHNVDVQACTHPDDIRARLVQQLYSPVRWVETIQKLTGEGVHTFVECGPGKVLTGLIKRIEESAQTFNLDPIADLELAITKLG